MTIKEYIKNKNLRISEISRSSGIPYTTVSEIVNGKLDIDRVQVGTALKIASACGVEFNELYEMCKDTSSLPKIDDGLIRIKNKSYYLAYDIGEHSGEMYLCKVNDTNTRYVKDMAEWSINDIKQDIKQQADYSEVESWSIDTI